jgi:hypothetical protein
VRELVDQNEPRLPLESRVEVELLHDHAPVAHLSPGQELQADDESAGVEAAMGLDHPDDDVALQVPLAPGGLEHRVRLAHARRGAEEDDELPAAGSPLLRRDTTQELVGVAARVAHGDTLEGPCAPMEESSRGREARVASSAMLPRE